MSGLDPELYTVAWFAPLEIEAQAALHMLDNKHRGRFPMGRGDDYVFQAGDMCGHNVIIATLPAGQEYGTGSAAALASQVKRFFPNLWFGLLVGVAAGLPNFSRYPPLDIRLGDILVGLPTSESAGLIAYDLGKETGQSGFQLLRFGHVLATTETVVRSAIGSIKLLAPNDAEVVSPYYECIKHKRHSNGTFVDPGQKQDILYQVEDDGNERLMEREIRPDDERTQVWYGTIGSGDKLMKNARKRNELRDKYNVIGLEMEAAGTMNRIPVGVIRGVCDYGDEHKNKEWQPYAAAMAAAYAKAVLSEIPARTIPNKPVAPQNGWVKKRRLDEEYPASITDDRRKKNCGYEEVVEASGSSNRRAAQSISRGQGIQQTALDDHIRCLQDLRITDPRDDKDRIQQTKGGLLADSYRWILDNADYRQWRDNRESRLLWIKGDPGKGKTMLICGIIDELKKSTADASLLSFFFCQGTDSRINNAPAVLRGLIYLLVNEQSSLIPHVRKKYDHAGKALFEDANAWVALSEIFANILQDPGLKSAYLIVDGLDECQKDLLQLLDLIVQMSSISSRIKWIVSSRNWPEIEKRLETAGEKVKLCLELNVESISAAVGKYIWYKVDQLARLQKYDKKTQDAVRDHLSSNANGTFLWVALVCQHLEKASRWNTLAKLNMNMFPPGLDALYKRIMEQICNSHDVDICKRILACVTTVYRPITLKELTSFDDELEATSDDLESLGEIIGLCGSFLTIREGIVYFVH
ncbi:hypothetical protein V2W45_1333867 [Cenococcum geophilum]